MGAEESLSPSSPLWGKKKKSYEKTQTKRCLVPSPPLPSPCLFPQAAVTSFFKACLVCPPQPRKPPPSPAPLFLLCHPHLVPGISLVLCWPPPRACFGWMLQQREKRGVETVLPTARGGDGFCFVGEGPGSTPLALYLGLTVPGNLLEGLGTAWSGP